MNARSLDVIEIEIPIFGMFLEVYLDKPEKLEEWAKAEFDIDDLELSREELNAVGLTLNLMENGTDGYVVIALKDFRKLLKDDMAHAVQILAHECLHAAKAVFESRNVPFTGDNEEMIAYTMDYLIKNILDRIA